MIANTGCGLLTLLIIQTSAFAAPYVIGNAVATQSLKHDLSAPLKLIPVKTSFRTQQLRRNPVPLSSELFGSPLLVGPNVDPALQLSSSGIPMRPPLISFEGVNNVMGYYPPDPNGDVGPNHYVQWVNVQFAIWDKHGNLLYGPAPGNTLWSGFGGICEAHNDGDPIVQYDQLADRWFMSQFAWGFRFDPQFPRMFHQCIAVSQTGDPTGAWYRYDFLISTFKENDYPKFGVWPDAYYMAINQFLPEHSAETAPAGQGAVAFERSRMLVGLPARMIYIDLNGVPDTRTFMAMLPSDLDGSTLPPAGSPNYFVNGIAPPFSATDELQFWKFHVDWADPGNSTFTGPENIDLTAAGLPFNFQPSCIFQDCIPQPIGAPSLDSTNERLMYRLAYRNFGTHESLVLNHTVDIDGTKHFGVRWYEVRDPGGAPPLLYQTGTYAGDTPDSEHRWEGSIAMDGTGNIALGYSVSSSTTFPSIRYVGRLASDPLSTLAQGEAVLMTGHGAQLGAIGGADNPKHRWGDYSMLAVDPTDDHTFWYTNEYYNVSSWAGWRTRIGSFRFIVSAGTIAFDHDTYACSASIGVTVTDRDLIGSGTLSIAVTTSGGDSESVNLNEIPSNSGVFVGSIASNSTAVVVSDGTLQVADGQTITATYSDANHGNGNPSSVQDTASVDCVAPMVSNVTAADVSDSQATATFDTDEAATARVRSGTSCASLIDSIDYPEFLTAHAIPLANLTQLTQYFFVIDVTDRAGNARTDDNGGACYSFTTFDPCHGQPDGVVCIGSDPNPCMNACAGGSCTAGTPVTLGACCGNGIVDADAGEQCDDGNLVSGDSCPSSCSYTASTSLIRGDRRNPAHDRTGCQIEWYVVSSSAQRDRFGLPSSNQVCDDQDPTCDFDSTPGRCAFQVVVCANNVDPNVPACTPNGVSSVRVLHPAPQQSRIDVLHTILQNDRTALEDALQALLDPMNPGAGYINHPPLSAPQLNFCSQPFLVDVFPGGLRRRSVTLLTQSQDAGSPRSRRRLSRLQLTCRIGP